ncbi:MAG TPA: lysophospholipid acyltransferase family protein, partial [Longimicrobiaceae bacterium]|nr:lysophospholipid acyltransferase family protein [Longimicrobiaceae bacterium]
MRAAVSVRTPVHSGAALRALSCTAMWLLPALSRLSSLALHTFYRLEVGGERVPPRGPVLLVANHPNSLLDPAAVAAAAGRPVRFLAKAPLFGDRGVGWLVRGAGAIPVYRAQDDPAKMGANTDTFRAAHAALAEGDAVGIFPEGLSHSEPSLAPLKTGAARIALGAAERTGGSFPIVPVGLVFRRKERFRSEALLVVGEPVAWDDLAGAGGGEAAAVRELTRRIDEALRDVTVNLERWEDAPMVEWAEEVFAAELGMG